PHPSAPKPKESPKAAVDPKHAEAPKPKKAAPAKIAMSLPPTPAPVESKPVRASGLSSGLSIGDMAQRAKAAVMSIASSERQTITEKLWGKPSSSGSLLSYASPDASITSSIGQNHNPVLRGCAPYERDPAV